MAPKRAQAPTPSLRTDDNVDRFLSCPYHKKDRMLHSACAHLKLRRIKDVKQHLMKRHRYPLYCSICGRAGFANVEERDGHVRAEQCNAPTGGFVPPLGLDLNQVSQLERRASRKSTKTEQWMQIWHIVFPGSAPPDSGPFLGDFVEESVGMLQEHWIACGQEIFEEYAAPHFAHQPHLRQGFHQAVCSVVAGFLASALAAHAGTRRRPTSSPNMALGAIQLQAAAPESAQAAEGAPPQDSGEQLYMNPNDLISSYQGVVIYGADAAATGWSFNNNDIAPFYPGHDNFNGYV